jgi:hypothetical protein
MDVDFWYFQEQSGQDQTFLDLGTVQGLCEYQTDENVQYILLGKLGRLNEEEKNQ